MGKMKLVAIAFGMLLTLSIGSTSWLLALPLDENTHELYMTVSCDNFEIDGKFDLEFKNSISYSIWGSRAPVPINFRCLYIETDSMRIGEKHLENVEGTTKIMAQPSKAQLYFYEEPGIPAEKMYISKITSFDGNTEVNFFSTSGESFVSVGRDSLIYLENRPATRKWILKIKGGFRVNEDEDMEDEMISFFGSLRIESPELPDSKNLILNFNSFHHLGNLQQEEGHILMESRHSLLPNRFMVELGGIENKDEVKEDGYRIDMTREFYKNDRFLREFQIENIYDAKIHDIKTGDQKLSVRATIKYNGETYFPRIKVTTKYFALTSDDKKGDFQVGISNLETGGKETVEFLDGRKYMIEILIERFVKDDIIVDFTHEDFQEEITKNDWPTGLVYEHEFTCYALSSKIQNIECFTKGTYRKRNEESPEIPFRTEGFYVEIQSRIEFDINDLKEIPETVKENERLSFSKRITLISEVSDSIEVRIYLDLKEGFGIKNFKYHPTSFSKQGDSIDIEVELMAPSIAEEKSYEIKIIMFYRMNETTNYDLYLPNSLETTIVENITVRRSTLGILFEAFPYLVSFAISLSFSSLQWKLISGSFLESGIRKFLEMHMEEKKQIGAILLVIRAFLFLGMFFLSLVIIFSALAYGTPIIPLSGFILVGTAVFGILIGIFIAYNFFKSRTPKGQ